MRLRVRHTTVYDYVQPVALHRHRLVLRPREGHDLRIVQMQLHIEPRHSVTWVRDVFGNSIAWIDFAEPATRLHIDNQFEVERLAPFPEHTLHRPLSVGYPVQYDPLELAVVSAYLGTAYDESADLSGWLSGALEINRDDAEGMVLGIARLIHQRISYRRREEKGVQSPTRTLELGSGSCRDMATLMMECCRELGMAARFASGYLHGSASLAGKASTHAWVEVYLPSLGWRGFDPTLAVPVDHRHIVTGVSNHPRGVMPVSGTYTGDRSHYAGMNVSVRTEVVGTPDVNT